MRVLKTLFVLLLITSSCKKEEKNDPLISKLENTTWKYDKIVLYEINGDIRKVIDLDTTFFCNETLNFQDYKKVNIGSNCYGIGCGEWTIEKQELHISVAFNQLITNYCIKENFSDYIHYSDIPTMQNDTLVFNGYSTIVRLYSSGYFDNSDYNMIMNDFKDKKINIKTFFHKENYEITNTQECCGKIEWWF